MNGGCNLQSFRQVFAVPVAVNVVPVAPVIQSTVIQQPVVVQQPVIVRQIRGCNRGVNINIRSRGRVSLRRGLFGRRILRF